MESEENARDVAAEKKEEASLPYERKYGLLKRLWGAIFKPDETFSDIALSPDYAGVILILIIEATLFIVTIYQLFGKINIVGPYASDVKGFLNMLMSMVSVMIFPFCVIRWLIKSVIIWKACDSGSNWTFSSAASVTGYAYIVEIISAAINMFVVSTLPSLTLDTSNPEMVTKQANEYISMFQSGYYPHMLIISFVFIFWKSYLGGLGTHYGTRKLCSKAFAMALFVILSLIGLAVNYLL